jgi:hypothetical protein
LHYPPDTPTCQYFANRQTLPDLAAYLPSVVSYKFAYEVRIALSVMPVETGIQTTLKHWIPGRASYRQLARNDDEILL